MRITCDVDTANRLLPSFNMRQRGKAMKSQLSIGRKPGAKVEDEVYLMICTKQDRNGAKYRASDTLCFLFSVLLYYYTGRIQTDTWSLVAWKKLQNV